MVKISPNFVALKNTNFTEGNRAIPALINLPSHCVVFVFSDTSPVIMKKNYLINNCPEKSPVIMKEKYPKNNFPNKRVLRNKTLSNVRAMEMNKTLRNQSRA